MSDPAAFVLARLAEADALACAEEVGAEHAGSCTPMGPHACWCRAPRASGGDPDRVDLRRRAEPCSPRERGV